MMDMIQTMRTDHTGLLNYEWFVDDSESTCQCYARFHDCYSIECYLDECARQFDKRLESLLTLRRFSVFGRLPDSLVEKLTAKGAKIVEPTAGFSR